MSSNNSRRHSFPQIDAGDPSARNASSEGGDVPLALQRIVAQLADPSLRAACTQCGPTLDHLAEVLEGFLADSNSRIQAEAQRTVKLVYLASFAQRLRMH